VRGFATSPHPKTLGQVAAANMHDGRWMFTRTIDPAKNFGNECEIIGVREYEAYDAVLVVDWLADRKAGYPSLAKFEGGANWPKFEHLTDETGLSG
jgi:hypothetical protein